jgi:hypothetical protein
MYNKAFIRGIGLLVITTILTGCANLPPLIQKHNGIYGLYLPTGQSLMQAMLYREDAKFKLPNGKDCILEHNSANGHTRFLYPNGGYVVMHGWRNMKYIDSTKTPDGSVMGLFLGTVNGQPQTEMLVIFTDTAINSVQLGNQSAEYGVKQLTQNHIIFQQIDNPSDPLLRLYTMNTGVLNYPVPLATIRAREAAVKLAQQEKVARAKARQQELVTQEHIAEQRQQEVLAARLRQRRQAQQQIIQTDQQHTTQQQQMVIQTVAISSGGVSVQSAVPMGHQKIVPQQVNLQ